MTEQYHAAQSCRSQASVRKQLSCAHLAMRFLIAVSTIGALAAEIAWIVEHAIRKHFKMSAASYDLALTAMVREIEETVDERLAGAIDLDDAMRRHRRRARGRR